MDPISRNVNKNEIKPFSGVDTNRIRNLSLKDHNHCGADGSMPQKQGKLQKALSEAYRKGWSPTATCCCGGPMNHPDRSDEVWTFPEPKLYSAAEDPTRKKYSPLAGPMKYTFIPMAMCNDDANSN